MKIKNIFKKKTKTVVKANVVTLEKKQLEKVVGGTDEASAERWQKSGIGHTIVS